MIHMITGGARSGKSSHAEKLALSQDDRPTYIATARKWDDDFNQRIKYHQQKRSSSWHNLEIEKNLSTATIKSHWVVIDCVTLWLTNLFYDNQQDIEISLQQARLEIDELDCRQDKSWLIITNELGMGLHAETAIGRRFVDLQGWINQYLAQKSDKVTLMISGVPMQIK